MEVKGTLEAANVETGEMVLKGIKDYKGKADDSSGNGISTLATKETS
jgi:hypothetical protein